MQNKNTDVQLPTLTEDVALPTVPVENLQKSIEQAEKYLAFQDRIRKTALNVTSASDWINESGKPYLQWTGTSKVARAFGVSLVEPVFEKESGSDEHGDYVEYTCMGTATWNGQSVTEVGAATSRDSLFGIRTDKKTGEKIYLPLSEISRVDVRKKALTNLMNRAIKSLIGLSFTWDEVEEITNGRINRQGVTGFSYDTGKNSGKTPETADTTKQRGEIRRMCLEMARGDVNVAAQILEDISSWKTKEGEQKPGKRNVVHLTERQVGIVYKQTERRYKDWEKDDPGGEGGDIAIGEGELDD